MGRKITLDKPDDYLGKDPEFPRMFARVHYSRARQMTEFGYGVLLRLNRLHPAERST